MQLTSTLATLLLLTLSVLAAPAVTNERRCNGNRARNNVDPSTYLGAGAPPENANQNRSIYNAIPADFVKKPTYQTFSSHDWNSIALGVHQEYFELDGFNEVIRRFSPEEFRAAGLSEEDVSLIQYMGNQEVGHARVLSNMLGPRAPKQCTFRFNFTTVEGSLQFLQWSTRWGESGVLGFLPQMDNRAVAQILLQSITTESRQQLILRQMQGLFPMPVFFEAGTPQAWQWTLLSPWIVSCPKENEPVRFNIYPSLNVTNQPDQNALSGPPAISNNVTAITRPGRELTFEWDEPGKTQGPYRQKTVKTGGQAKYAAFVSQLNVTYSELYDVNFVNGRNVGKARQPGGTVLPELTLDPIINGTMFVALVDRRLALTPANLSIINDIMVAGPSIYASG